MISKKKLSEKVLSRVRCPKCGSKVLVPSFTLADPMSGNDADIPEVWCSDMGHWAGKLSECLNYKKK